MQNIEVKYNDCCWEIEIPPAGVHPMVTDAMRSTLVQPLAGVYIPQAGICHVGDVK